VQRDSLINRPQLMKAFSPKRTDPQTEINLGERSNGYTHGWMILTTKHTTREFEVLCDSVSLW
jgi:hypothetical protein